MDDLIGGEPFRVFDRRATAAHEMGHSLTAWLNGIAVYRVEINRDNNGGVTKLVKKYLPEWCIPYYLIGILAGGIAEHRYWKEFSSLSASRIERIIEVSTTTDRCIFRDHFGECDWTESKLVSTAHKIVDRCWSRILIRSDVLFRERVLTGSSTK